MTYLDFGWQDDLADYCFTVSVINSVLIDTKAKRFDLTDGKENHDLHIC